MSLLPLLQHVAKIVVVSQTFACRGPSRRRRGGEHLRLRPSDEPVRQQLHGGRPLRRVLLEAAADEALQLRGRGGRRGGRVGVADRAHERRPVAQLPQVLPEREPAQVELEDAEAEAPDVAGVPVVGAVVQAGAGGGTRSRRAPAAPRRRGTPPTRCAGPPGTRRPCTPAGSAARRPARTCRGTARWPGARRCAGWRSRA